LLDAPANSNKLQTKLPLRDKVDKKREASSLKPLPLNRKAVKTLKAKRRQLKLPRTTQRRQKENLLRAEKTLLAMMQLFLQRRA
jgi:hypothetical protein